MKLIEAKQKFVNAWGTVGPTWGINKTMAQIHALLMITTEPISADHIMQALKISRGNVNMNVRTLMDWGLVYKELVPGERKEFFVAEKNVMDMSRKIFIERRKKELHPLMKALKGVSKVDDKSVDKKELMAFEGMVKELSNFSSQMDSLAEKFIQSGDNWFYKVLMRLIK